MPSRKKHWTSGILKYQDGTGGGGMLPMSHSLATNYGDIDRFKLLAEAQAKAVQDAKTQQINEQAQFGQGPKGSTVQQWNPVSARTKLQRAALNPVTAAKALADKGTLPENYGDRNVLDYATDVINPATYVKAGSDVLSGTGEALSAGNLSDFAMGVAKAGQGAMQVLPAVHDLGEALSNASHPLLNTIPYLNSNTIGTYAKAAVLGGANEFADEFSKTPGLSSLYKKAAYNVGKMSASAARDISELNVSDVLGKKATRYTGAIGSAEEGNRNLLRNYIYGDTRGFKKSGLPLTGLGKYTDMYGDIPKYQMDAEHFGPISSRDIPYSFREKYGIHYNATKEDIDKLLDEHGGTLYAGVDEHESPINPNDNIAGHVGYITRAEDGTHMYRSQDLWKFNPEDYNKKWYSPFDEDYLKEMKNDDPEKFSVRKDAYVNKYLGDYIKPMQSSLMDKAGKPFALLHETPINYVKRETPLPSEQFNPSYKSGTIDITKKPWEEEGTMTEEEMDRLDREWETTHGGYRPGSYRGPDEELKPIFSLGLGGIMKKKYQDGGDMTFTPIGNGVPFTPTGYTNLAATQESLGWSPISTTSTSTRSNSSGGMNNALAGSVSGIMGSLLSLMDKPEVASQQPLVNPMTMRAMFSPYAFGGSVQDLSDDEMNQVQQFADQNGVTVEDALNYINTQMYQNQTADMPQTYDQEDGSPDESDMASAPQFAKGGWIKKAAASIKRRGTKGKCTPMSKPGCTGRALALAKTFHKIARNRKKKGKHAMGGIMFANGGIVPPGRAAYNASNYIAFGDQGKAAYDLGWTPISVNKDGTGTYTNSYAGANRVYGSDTNKDNIGNPVGSMQVDVNKNGLFNMYTVDNSGNRVGGNNNYIMWQRPFSEVNDYFTNNMVRARATTIPESSIAKETTPGLLPTDASTEMRNRAGQLRALGGIMRYADGGYTGGDDTVGITHIPRQFHLINPQLDKSGSVPVSTATPNLGATNTPSIVDYLKSKGLDSSYSHRTKLAEAAGINDYKGTAEQNEHILSTLSGSDVNGTAARTLIRKSATNKQAKNVKGNAVNPTPVTNTVTAGSTAQPVSGNVQPVTGRPNGSNQAGGVTPTGGSVTPAQGRTMPTFSTDSNDYYNEGIKNGWITPPAQDFGTQRLPNTTVTANTPAPVDSTARAGNEPTWQERKAAAEKNNVWDAYWNNYNSYLAKARATPRKVYHNPTGDWQKFNTQNIVNGTVTDPNTGDIYTVKNHRVVGKNPKGSPLNRNTEPYNFKGNGRVGGFATGGTLSRSKARQMLHDGTAHGQPITEKQRKYFGYISNKKAMGGNMTDAEVEGGEIMQAPGKKPQRVYGPKHEDGGVMVNAPVGTKVFSDRLQVDGKTMADRKIAREKALAKLEKALNADPTNKILKSTAERMHETIKMEESQDMNLQNYANNNYQQPQMGDQENSQEDMGESTEEAAYGKYLGMYDGTGVYAGGTGDNGIDFNTEVPRYPGLSLALNDDYNYPVSRYDPSFGSSFYPYGLQKEPTMAPLVGEVPNLRKTLALSLDSPESIPLGQAGYAGSYNLNARHPSSVPMFGKQTFKLPGFDEAGNIQYGDVAGTSGIPSRNTSNSNKNPYAFKPGLGDYIGGLGAIAGPVMGLMNTEANRRATEANARTNRYQGVGQRAIDAWRAAQGYAYNDYGEDIRDIATKYNTLGANYRAGASSVNTLRGVLPMLTAGQTGEDLKARELYGRRMEDLLGKEGEATYRQDVDQARGATAIDEAKAQDIDAYFSSRGQNLEDIAGGVQNIGALFNKTRENQTNMNLISQLSKYGLGFDNNGNLVDINTIRNKKTT
jgi:hypothetical protein